MEPIIERCCGLDVHQATVVACVLVADGGRNPRKEVRTFSTMTRSLLELRDWLEERGCTHVAMESTGIFWRPVYALLEGAFELVVGNAQHMKNVPGRKTDVKDAEWIAQLLRMGLIRKSFVPPQPIRELRDLMRYRRRVVEARSDERNRLLKMLETANIKLSSVATNVFGKSGVSMLEALLKGEQDLEQIADLAYGRMRPKKKALEDALDGRLQEHHRFMLRLQLDRLRRVEEDLRRIDEFADQRLAPYAAQQKALTKIPGVGEHTAAVIISEMGVDATAFQSPHHFAAWAGLAPGNNESAGKRLTGRTRKGNPHLRSALVEAANGAVRTKGSYINAKYYRLKARCGAARAMVAIAHKIALAAYRVIATGEDHVDLGASYLDRLAGERTTRKLVQRLEGLGYEVVLARAAPP